MSEAHLVNVCFLTLPTGTSNTRMTPKEANGGISIANQVSAQSLKVDAGRLNRLTRFYLQTWFVDNSFFKRAGLTMISQALSDKALGGLMLAVAAIVFTYYTAWALLLVRYHLVAYVSLSSTRIISALLSYVAPYS